MFSPAEIEAAFRELGITHVVWVPDSTTGQWEAALEESSAITLVRVCREGEAWAVAAGLLMGGARPIVSIQNTGLFESGDALRNVLFELELPVFAMIGYRNYLMPQSQDTAKTFTEPILSAWGLKPVLLNGEDAMKNLMDHYRSCQEKQQPGIALLAEGRG